MLTWECVLEDGTVVKESEGAKFDLEWEKGGVAEFRLVDESNLFSLLIPQGTFNINGQTEKTNASEPKLRYFKRNTVKIDPKTGQILAKIVWYFIGYKDQDQEKLLKIVPTEGSYETSYATRD
jgi:hypothetical protein